MLQYFFTLFRDLNTATVYKHRWWCLKRLLHATFSKKLLHAPYCCCALSLSLLLSLVQRRKNFHRSLFFRRCSELAAPLTVLGAVLWFSLSFLAGT
jgi:hypothetical protein